ncbi:MAG: ATPase, partial [Prevotella sp.]|nr:ATPase [Prevotella sp.]
EFQTITKYPEKNVEALLRTYVQQCRNAVFMFAGSHRTIMNEMFSSPARPFYQSITMMNLGVIDQERYIEFAQQQFKKHGKEIDAQVVEDIYKLFEGTTWYLQKMLNELFILTGVGECCTQDFVEVALTNILRQNDDTYRDMLFLLSAKQVALLVAICKEGKAIKITGGEFIKRYKLTSASSVQKGVKTLLAQQMITHTRGCYEIYDKFLALWITRHYN